MTRYKNTDGTPIIPIRTYIEFFFKKYKKLSSTDLLILLSDSMKKDLPFKNLKTNISIILNKLKKEGKVSKVKPMKWQWIEK